MLPSWHLKGANADKVAGEAAYWPATGDDSLGFAPD